MPSPAPTPTIFVVDDDEGLLFLIEMFSNALAEDLKGHDAVLAKQARRLNHELRETVTQARLISHRNSPRSPPRIALGHQ